MRAPLHEFRFTPVTSKVVKLVAEAYVEGRSWGRVCSVRLYGKG